MADLLGIDLTTVNDTTVGDTAAPGQRVTQFDVHYGERTFIYVRGGAAAAVNVPYSRENYDTTPGTSGVVSVATAGTTKLICSASTFTANAYNLACLAQITDDAGAAGAAPEGETARILRNDTTTLFLHGDDTVTSTGAADTFVIHRFHTSRAAANADTKNETLGVGIGTITIAYGGFLIQRGYTTVACVAATSAVTEGTGLKPATATLIAIDDANDAGEYVGSTVGDELANDSVLRLVPALVTMGDI